MSEELILEGKSYISSRRASEISGYAQDYIGQLARGGLVDARRVGGLWYLSLESLNSYKEKAELYTPVPPSPIAAAPDPESIVTFDGKDYVSAGRAAKITGYNQDYVGQLARSGKVLSRQVGNRWYVDREGIIAHKREKDALLAAVQAESVGVAPSQRAHVARAPHAPAPEELLTYFSDDRPLVPVIAERATDEEASPAETISHQIPIRTMPTLSDIRVIAPRERRSRPVRTSGKTISQAAKVAGVLTVVIMLSYAASTLKDSAVYTSNIKKAGQSVSASALSASALEAVQAIGDRLEKLLTPDLSYTRPSDQ